MTHDRTMAIAGHDLVMKHVESTVRLALGLAFMALAVAVFGVVCVLLLPSRRARIVTCNVFGHIVGRTCLAIAGARVDGGLDRSKLVHPAIYVSNHASILDIFVGIWVSPMFTCGVAKREVVYYPFFGQLYAISGHLLIDRSRTDRAIDALSTLARLVRKYRIGVWIWPEGTRSRDGRLRPLKKGFAHIAIATGLPIQPVVVSGAHRVWPTRKLGLRPGPITITVLDPIPTTGWSEDTLDAHLAEVHDAMARALPDDQKPLPVEAPVRRAA